MTGKRESSLPLRVVTSLFICNYSPSRPISWEDRYVCLVSKGERASSWLTGIFATPVLYADTSAGQSFSLSLSSSCVCRRVSRVVVVKQNGKKDEGETLCRVPWQNADKSVWSPRRGRRLWKSRETGTRAHERAWDERTDPFKSSYSRCSDTRRQHCLLAALLTMVAVIARVS